MRDYYAILEVSPTASQETIREQYLLLIQAWHPDKFSNTAQKAKAEEISKEINTAYDVLKNPQKRAIYDNNRTGQSSKVREKQSQQQAEEQRRSKQAEEAQRRTNFERKQREQGEGEKRRNEFENQQKGLKELRQQKLVIIIAICIPFLAIIGAFIRYIYINNSSASESPQVSFGKINPKPSLVEDNTLTAALLTITPSPSYDLKNLQSNLKSFLLQESDIPLNLEFSHQYYYFPNNRYENDSAHFVETGRIDGWGVRYNKGSLLYDNGAIEITDFVTLYNSSVGAQLEITKYGDVVGYSEVINPPEIGDITRSFFSIGSTEEQYVIEFSYKNLSHDINIYGHYNDNVNPDLIGNIAHVVLEKLQASTLMNH